MKNIFYILSSKKKIVRKMAMLKNKNKENHYTAKQTAQKT